MNHNKIKKSTNFTPCKLLIDFLFNEEVLCSSISYYCFAGQISCSKLQIISLLPNNFQKIIQLCIKKIKFTITFKWFVLLLTDYFLFLSSRTLDYSGVLFFM